MYNRTNLAKKLEQNPVGVSLPAGRLDISGTWDLPQLSLIYNHIEPATTNISLGTRTYCHLRPYKNGFIKISAGDKSEVQPADNLVFTPDKTDFGLCYAIANSFNVDGLEIEYEFGLPPKSGLGGSGILSVATISALDAARSRNDDSYLPLSQSQIINLAHNIENGLGFSMTGHQDQCATYGGVNFWRWTYGEPRSPSNFVQVEVLEEKDFQELESRIALAYQGKSHDSNEVNARQVRGFLDGSARKEWFRINNIAREFADALRKKNWEYAGQLQLEEHQIRCKLVPERKTAIAQKLEEIAKDYDSGFSTTGAGKGGCVWALAKTPEEAEAIKRDWKELLKNNPEAEILSSEIARSGVIINSD